MAKTVRLNEGEIMYIESTTRYYKGSEQCIRAARFLCLVQSKDRSCGRENFRACVSRVALQQCGHWMMGRARVGKNWYTVSGSYGGDGLTMDVSEADFLLCKEVPDELYEAWAHGGGHNECGSEASLMRNWAVKNFPVKKK